MAARAITIEIAGDETKLVNAFKNVGKATDKLEADFDDTSKKAKSFGGAMDRAGDATDATEGKFGGMADVLDGLGGAFGLPTEGATNMMRSFADLGGGFGQILPMIGKLGGSLGALATGPVGLVIGAIGLLAAGLVLAYQKSETFREIVQGVFEKVKSVVGPIIDGIGKALSWVGGLFGKSGDDAKDSAEEHKKAAEAIRASYDDMFGRISGVLGQMGTVFQGFRHEQTLTLGQATTNLRQMVDEQEKWLEDIRVIHQKYGADVAQYVIAQGANFHGVADQLANATGRMGGQFVEQIRGLRAVEFQAKGLAAVFSDLDHEYRTLKGQGSVVGPGFAGVGRRASGGPVTAGRPYIVGERGPEMFVPGSSGAIVPNGGGTTVVVNMGVVGDPSQAARQIVSLLQQEQRRSGSLGFN